MFRDEELRLKLLQIANNNDKGITSLIGDAQTLLAFVEGRLPSYSDNELKDEFITWEEGEEPEPNVEPLSIEPQPVIYPNVTAWSTREVYPESFYYSNDGVSVNSVESNTVQCTSHHEPNYSYEYVEDSGDVGGEPVDVSEEFAQPEKRTFIQKLDAYLDADPKFWGEKHALDRLATRELYIASAVNALFKKKLAAIYKEIDEELGLEVPPDLARHADPLVDECVKHIYKVTPESRYETIDKPIDYSNPPVVEPHTPEETAIAEFKRRFKFSGMLSTGNEEKDTKMISDLLTNDDNKVDLNKLFDPEKKDIVYPEKLKELFDEIAKVANKTREDNKRVDYLKEDFCGKNGKMTYICMDYIAKFFDNYERELNDPKPDVEDVNEEVSE